MKTTVHLSTLTRLAEGRSWCDRPRPFWAAPRLVALVISFCVMCGGTGSARLAVAGDAVTPPDFRAVVPDEEYQRRRDAALKAAGDLADVAKSAMPALGCVVTHFSAESKAVAAGMSVGSITFRFDDEPVRWKELPWQQKDTSLWYFDPKTRRVGSVVARPGSFGVFYDLHWRPELLYVRRKQRVAQVEQDVIVGITQRATDPDLAETAWKHAIAGGYVADSLSHQCGAEIALAQGRTAEAWRFAAAALAAGDGEPVSPVAMYRAALANFQWKAMADLAGRFPQTLGVNARELSSFAEERKESATGVESAPAPAIRANAMYRDDLLPRTWLTPRTAVPSLLKGLSKDHPLNLDSATDTRADMKFRSQEQLRNVEFQVRFTATPTDSNRANYPKAVYFSIGSELAGVSEFLGSEAASETGQGEYDAPALLTLSLQPDSQIGVQLGATGQFAFKAPELMSDAEPIHEIRMILVDGRGEILLNGKRIAYVPVGKEDSFRTFSVMSVGMKARIQDLKISELIERKD